MGKRISQLELASPLTSSDMIAVVQSGRTKRAPMDNVRSFANSSCQCTLVSRYNTVGTDANTIKKYLHTYTLPDDVMNVDGNWLEIHAAGYFAANGNGKLISVGIKQNSSGHYALYSIPVSTYNDDYWEIDLIIQRSSQTTYVVGKDVTVTPNAATLQTSGNLLTSGDVTGISWDVADVQITVEGTNSTASANDIVCHTFIVRANLLDPNS